MICLLFQTTKISHHYKKHLHVCLDTVVEVEIAYLRNMLSIIKSIPWMHILGYVQISYKKDTLFTVSDANYLMTCLTKVRESRKEQFYRVKNLKKLHLLLAQTKAKRDLVLACPSTILLIGKT